MTAGEIAACFEMTKPSVSHRLSILNAGERHGQKIVYSLNTTIFQQLMQWLFDVSGAAGNERGTEDDIQTP